MSESRGCRGLWRRRPEGWGQTHRQRLAVSFSLSFGALLLVCLAVVYVSQYRFLYRTVRRTLHRFTTEFQFEYICQREEPRGGRPLSVSSLPPGCAETLARELPRFEPLTAFELPSGAQLVLAGSEDGKPVELVYDVVSEFVVSRRVHSSSGSLEYIRVEFTEESYGHGTNEQFLLVMSPSGAVLAQSDFDGRFLPCFGQLFASGVPDREFHELECGGVSVLAHTSRLYDGNVLVTAASFERFERHLGQLPAIFGLTLLLMFPLCVLVAAVVSRRLTRGLVQVSRCADAFAGGDFAVRMPPMREDRELDRLAQAFNRMADSTQKLLTELENVTDDIAHDLKTPLTRMKAQAELELMRHGDVEFASTVAENCDDMLSAIQTMLDITRVEKRLADGRPQPVGLCGLLRKLHEAFSTLAEDKGLAFALSLPDREVMLSCQPKRMEQLVANLIDNAIKYTPEGGQVQMALEQTGTDVRLTVADTGVGIAAKDLPLIFGRFFRADTSRSQPGNGLGLSMVKAVAESLGGQVAVTSEPGRGAEFVVTLPLSPA